jgi:ADP-ribose pyrophosphatase YjhB (NUDIX family)
MREGAAEKGNFERRMVSLSPNSRKEILSFCYGIAVTLLLVLVVWRFGIPSTEGDLGGGSDIPIPFEKFPEPAWRTPNTISARTVTSTPFARFEIHQVRTESGAVVNDWLWTDERSHINMLIHLKEEDKYMLFHQKKYGLKEAKYATLGGLFNEGETPEQCARRELLEEAGLEAEELVSMGAYRVQVNRGGGILHAFLARNAFPSSKRSKSDDYEKQEKRLLTREELLGVALSGEVGEAQWVATVALGLLHDQHSKGTKELKEAKQPQDSQTAPAPAAPAAPAAHVAPALAMHSTSVYTTPST